MLEGPRAGAGVCGRAEREQPGEAQRADTLYLVQAALLPASRELELRHARIIASRSRTGQSGRYGGNVAGDDAQVLELAGREVRITSPDKVLFGERGETKLDLVRYYAAVAEPLMRAMGGRPVLMQRFPQGAGGPSFFQKRVPRQRAGLASRRRPCRPSTARRRGRSWRPTSRTSRGRSTSPAWASTSGRTAPTTPSTPTSCASTSTRSPAPGSPRRAPPPGSSRRCSTSSASPAIPKTTGNRGLHVYVRLEPRWDSYEVRSAAVAAARELERRRPDILTAAWWKEERGRADLRRLQPERAAQDGVRRVVGARAQGRAGLDAGRLGRARRRRPGRADARDRARAALERDGDPWAAIDDAPQSLEPLLALHERDRANGLLDAPWPPVYPKQPDEPPRVAPSRARKPD